MELKHERTYINVKRFIPKAIDLMMLQEAVSSNLLYPESPTPLPFSMSDGRLREPDELTVSVGLRGRVPRRRDSGQ